MAKRAKKKQQQEQPITDAAELDTMPRQPAREVPKTPSKLGEKPRYAKYAFFNVYNLSLLGGSFLAALTTGYWPFAVAGIAAEAIWMLFAPDSRALRKLWFDKVYEHEQGEERARLRSERYHLLPEEHKERVRALSDLKQRIEKLSDENPSFAGELLRGELDRLNGLTDDFLDIMDACRRYQEHLDTIDTNALESDERRYQQQLEKHVAGDDARAVAQKNLEVVLLRKERWQELRSHLSTARGQLDLIENTLRLLADDIMTMRSPREMGNRLEELRGGVEAVRETARETERPFTLTAS